MAYMKFKELTKYFDFYAEVDIKKLPDYTTEYVREDERILLGYKTMRDHAVFTNKTMILFDRDIVGAAKRIHMIPYSSISTGMISFKPGKAEILLSLESGYQLRIHFIDMNHDKKENLKIVFKEMMQHVR